jgi:uncharacterized membrane protein
VITSLAWEEHQLILLDVAAAVRYCDGCFTLNGDRLPAVTEVHSGTVAHFLADLALGAPPLTGAAVGAMLGTIGATTEKVAISGNFDREVDGLIKPGTSVPLVLDEAGDMDAIIHAIRGLGGMALKTDVDLEPAKLVQELRSEDKQTASQAFDQQLIMQLLRASVGSTEASNGRLARVGRIDRSIRQVTSQVHASLYACHHLLMNGYRSQLLRCRRTEAPPGDHGLLNSGGFPAP